MRGTQARRIRKLALKYAVVNAKSVGAGKLQRVTHKDARAFGFLRYSGYPRVYRDMKKSYTEGKMI